jgi:hypothetical protein
MLVHLLVCVEAHEQNDNVSLSLLPSTTHTVTLSHVQGDCKHSINIFSTPEEHKVCVCRLEHTVIAVP